MHLSVNLVLTLLIKESKVLKSNDIAVVIKITDSSYIDSYIYRCM